MKTACVTLWLPITWPLIASRKISHTETLVTNSVKFRLRYTHFVWKWAFQNSVCKMSPILNEQRLSCFPGPCLTSIMETSTSGQMLTGCRIANYASLISDTSGGIFKLCLWGTRQGVGYYTDDTNTYPPTGNYYSCDPGETLRLASCNLGAIRPSSGTCYTTYVLPEYFSP